MSRGLINLHRNQLADWMEVPHSKWETVVRRMDQFGQVLDAVQRKSGTVRAVVNRLGMALLTRQAVALTRYERAAFAIPTTLRAAWGIAGDVAAPGQQPGQQPGEKTR